jgi:excisionase family DNA binding protein
VVEPDDAMPAGSVTVVNASSWTSRSRELATLVLAAGNRPEGARVVPDPSGRAPDSKEIALVSDPSYWHDHLAELADALTPSASGPGGGGKAAGAAPASAERLTLTVEEAASILGISRAGAYDAVQRGEIPSIRIGRRILVPRAALDRLLGGNAPHNSDA